MYARAVDDAARQLHEWRFEERAGFVLGPLVLALSVAATQVGPAFALPLFFGGLYVMVRVAVAAVHRCNLLDRLAEQPDAYAIPEVAARASRVAAPASRRTMAASIRSLTKAWCDDAARDPVRRCAAEFEALAGELERGDLELDPAVAVICRHLVEETTISSLLAPGFDAEELICRVRHIRAAFRSAPD